MAIIPQTPIVIPAIPEKVFSEQWVYNLNVHAPTVSTGAVSIELLPYDPIGQEIGSGSLVQAVRTDRLWQAINEVPEVAAAFQAVIGCVGPLRTWIEQQNAPVLPPIVEPVVEPEVVVEPIVEPEVVVEPIVEPIVEPVVEPEVVVEPDVVVEPEVVVEPQPEVVIEPVLQTKKTSSRKTSI